MHNPRIHLAAYFYFDGGRFDPVEIFADPVVGESFDGSVEADEPLVLRVSVETSAFDIPIRNVGPERAIPGIVVVNSDRVAKRAEGKQLVAVFAWAFDGEEEVGRVGKGGGVKIRG